MNVWKKLPNSTQNQLIAELAVGARWILLAQALGYSAFEINLINDRYYSDITAQAISFIGSMQVRQTSFREVFRASIKLDSLALKLTLRRLLDPIGQIIVPEPNSILEQLYRNRDVTRRVTYERLQDLLRELHRRHEPDRSLLDVAHKHLRLAPELSMQLDCTACAWMFLLTRGSLTSRSPFGSCVIYTPPELIELLNKRIQLLCPWEQDILTEQAQLLSI